MRLAIVGSRSVSQDCYEDILNYIPENVTEIITGGAKGADQLAERYAKEFQLPIRIFRPDYKTYHKSAPLMRNRTIVENADYVLVLWDGRSRGSANVANLCIELHKEVHIILIRDGRLVETLFGQGDGRLF